MNRPATKPTPPAAKAPPVSRSLFRSDDLPAGERFLVWRESIAPLFSTHLAENKKIEDFTGQTEAYMLGEAMLATTAMSGIGCYRGDGSGPRSDRSEVFLIQLYMQGGFRGHNGAQTMEVSHGDVVILDSTRPMVTHVSDSKLLSFIVPRQALLASLGKQADVLPRVVSGRTALGWILGNALLSAWRGMQEASLEEAKAVDRLLLGALAGFLRDPAQPGTATPMLAAAVEQVTVDAIRAYIERHLSHPNLGPDLLCRRFGCSRSTLYRLFAPMHGVANYIRRARLERSQADLLGAPINFTAAQVARRWGFADYSNFRRLFRNAFGLSPSETMEIGRARQADPAGAMAPAGTPHLWLPEYRHWLERM